MSPLTRWRDLCARERARTDEVAEALRSASKADDDACARCSTAEAEEETESEPG
jgi:hypothetical protein